MDSSNASYLARFDLQIVDKSIPTLTVFPIYFIKTTIIQTDILISLFKTNFEIKKKVAEKYI